MVVSLRRFMLLENVGHILSKDMTAVMDFMLEELLCVVAVFSTLRFSFIRRSKRES